MQITELKQNLTALEKKLQNNEKKATDAEAVIQQQEKELRDAEDREKLYTQ